MNSLLMNPDTGTTYTLKKWMEIRDEMGLSLDDIDDFIEVEEVVFRKNEYFMLPYTGTVAKWEQWVKRGEVDKDLEDVDLDSLIPVEWNHRSKCWEWVW